MIYFQTHRKHTVIEKIELCIDGWVLMNVTIMDFLSTIYYHKYAHGEE